MKQCTCRGFIDVDKQDSNIFNAALSLGLSRLLMRISLKIKIRKKYNSRFTKYETATQITLSKNTKKMLDTNRGSNKVSSSEKNIVNATVSNKNKLEK